MSFNAADPKQVAERRVTEISETKLADADLKMVLSTLEGRRFLWRLLSTCGIYRTSFHPSSQIYFNEGVRSVGLNVIADIDRVAPEAMILMMTENSGKQRLTSV